MAYTLFLTILSMADKTLIHLRDYQQEIVARVHQEWNQHRSVMVQMPTGTGKTYVLAEVVESFRSTGVQKGTNASWRGGVCPPRNGKYKHSFGQADPASTVGGRILTNN